MKRIAAGLMWTFVLLWAGNYLVYFAGLQAVVAPIVAVSLGSCVAIDPLHLVWSKTAAHRSMVETGPNAKVESLART